jgi:3-oxoacyl-[acyl-carrier-protein] synthase-1/3-oxoacyl-[acyl-carrier-protein] synthase II
MDAQVAFFSAPDLRAELGQKTPYFAPLTALSVLGVEPVLRVQLLAACASSTIAIGLGCRWLEAEHADLVIAGGYDALSVLIAAGFESLGATTEKQPAPFRCDRDGMALGEGAALLALGRHSLDGAPMLGCVVGFGAASDAVHVTAPDPEGAGLARAAERALAEAAEWGQSIELVSAHATATPLNDAAEARALRRVLGARATSVVVHPFKAAIGHTLGASGALEALAALDASKRGILPGALGSSEIDPEFAGVLLPRNAPGHARHVLKLSAAFGGANAALVLGTESPTLGQRVPRRRREVRLQSTGGPQTALDVGAIARVLSPACPSAHWARLDSVSELAVAALGDAISGVEHWLPEKTGVVVGTSSATMEVNQRFDSKRRTDGVTQVEPRRFPATSPNLCAGQCNIAFGLLGPSLAVGGGLAAPVEALLVAHDLLEAGDCEAMAVVAVEDSGEQVRAAWSSAGWPVPPRGAAAVILCASQAGPRLNRARLLALHRQSTAELGRLGDKDPGWPVLLEAVRDACSG